MSIPTMTNSTAPVGATMPRIIPWLGWFRAFRIVPLLALRTILQPVGRVLGASAYHGTWLRASPFMCALDTVSLVIRLLAYCAFVHGAPRNVILAIRRDRFENFESNYSRETMFETIRRLLEFLFSTCPLIYAWGARSEIKWTVAFALMYIASFVALETIMQLTKYLHSVAPKAASDIKLQTIVPAPDFELKASTRGKEDDEGYEAPLIKSAKDTAVGASDIGEKDVKDENSYAVLQGRSCRPASSAGEGDNDSSHPLLQEKSTKSATRANATDLGAAEDSQADDPLTSARFLRLKSKLDSFDTVLLGVGCILHVIFVYWAFLDFIHPYLGNSIRSTSFWSFPTHFVSIPVTTLVLFTILGPSLFVMFFLCLLVYGTGAFLIALGKPAWLSFQAFVRGWMDRHPTIQSVVAITTTRVGEWANKTMAVFMSVTDKYPFIFAIVMIVTVGPFMIVAFLIWSAVAVFIAQFLWTEYMLWVYDLISAEFAVLLIFGLVCFWLRGWLKWVVEKGWLSNESSEVSPYLDDMGITLFIGVIISFVVLTLWYGFRYPYFEVGKWRDNWRENLDF